jgi:asparagine synthase (glutamine-hydrolysing)
MGRFIIIKLRDGILKSTFRTKSDSEVIVHLYEEFGYDNKLDGDFALVVINGDDFVAARDPLGVKPLYYGLDERGRIYFASEMKSLADQCKTFFTFPPDIIIHKKQVLLSITSLSMKIMKRLIKI